MKAAAGNALRYAAHLFVLLSALLLSACAPAAPLSAPVTAGADPAAGTVPPEGFTYPEGDTVRVATWNAEHFVDEYDNPYIDNRREDEPYDNMPERTRLFVEVIRALDADVVVLQEFESAAFLERLAEERFPEMGYRFFAGTESRDWYQNVVVMSRLPLGVVESYAAVTTPVIGAREPPAQRLTNNRMWMAEVLARPDYTFALVGLHLKAGPGARNEGWRTGQIRFLRERFDQLLAARPEANLLVVGDLNALPGSPELGLLLGEARSAEGRARLTDPLAGRPTPTFPSDAPERQLDYVLLGENMLPELVEGSVRVATPLSSGQMRRASDHLPVVAAFIAEERAAGRRPTADDGRPMDTR